MDEIKWAISEIKKWWGFRSNLKKKKKRRPFIIWKLSTNESVWGQLYDFNNIVSKKIR